MPLLTGLLTFVLVLDCVLLILLILVQLPKKEAGMGTAFGGGATDALFGAGTGNVLTKTTKYAAAVFLVLALTLSIINSNASKEKNNSNVQKELLNPKATPPAAVTPSIKNPPPSPQAQAPSVLVVTNAAQITTNALAELLKNAAKAATTNSAPTNAPVATNAPAKAPAAK